MGESAAGVNHYLPNGRVWKWVSGVLGVLLVAAIVGLVTSIRKIERVETTQELMGEDVATNTQWIADWSAVLRVPERDQKQDSDIEALKQQGEELKRRLTVLEGGRHP